MLVCVRALSRRALTSITCLLTLAPLSMKTRMTSSSEWSTAIISGVKPYSSARSIVLSTSSMVSPARADEARMQISGKHSGSAESMQENSRAS
eukprot:6214546-Pleurochrysis_carterae.AAC.5